MKQLNEREQQIELIAKDLLEQYGLSHLKLTLRKMTRTLGQYSHYRQRIQLSTHAINTKSYRIMVNTILHEIAHALTPGNGHNLIWKAKARELGVLPRATASDEQRLKWIEKEN